MQPRERNERGSVTVELAAALPVVVLVLGLIFVALAWARSGVEATKAAALGARIAAVEGTDVAQAELSRAMPHAQVYVHDTDGRVKVRVVIDGAAWLPDATGTAIARVVP